MSGRAALRRGARWRAALAGVAALALVVHSAAGFVPDAERVTRAVAGVNKASGRAQALKLELDMRIEDGDVIAVGELVTHPTGLARLELRGAGGLVERHILQGSQHQASRNGVRLDQYRAFLPPLFLLQANSKLTLDAALTDFGVRRQAIGLAPCGESNCYVLGDPGRVVSAVEVDAERVAAPLLAGEVLGAFATIWVDIASYDVLRIESARGVKTTLGPVIKSDGVRAPSWILVEEPGLSFVRFEVTRVTPVNAPAAAFGEQWLMAPVQPPEPAPSPVDPQSS